MELRNLKTFVTIARLQSFSQAADLLGYAQSTVTAHFAAGEIARGELVALPWDGPAFNVLAQLVYHKQKWLSPALKAFVNLAANRLHPGDGPESE